MTGYRRCVEQRERESRMYFTNMSKSVQVGSLLLNIAVQVLAPSYNLLPRCQQLQLVASL